MGHDLQVVERSKAVHQSVCNFVCSVVPDLYYLVVSFLVGNETGSEGLLVLVYLLLSCCYDIALFFGDLHVSNGDGYSSSCGVLVTHGLDVVQHENCTGVSVSLEALVNDLSKFFLSAKEINFKSERIFASVYESEILRDSLVEDESSHSGFHKALAV